jgi:hypothetical protein
VPFGEAYRRFLKKHSLREADVDESVFASVRVREAGRKVTL